MGVDEPRLAGDVHRAPDVVVVGDDAGLADCGTGLYLLLGFLEVTDQLPYDEAPAMFRLLCVVIALALLTALCFFGCAWYSKRKKANL